MGNTLVMLALKRGEEEWRKLVGGSSVSIDLSHTHEDLSLTLEPMSKSLNAVVHVFVIQVLGKQRG